MASVREIARLMVKLEASGVAQTAAAVLAVDDAGRRASKSTDGLDRSFRNAKSSASGAGDEVSKVARSMDDASRAARANATATSTQSDAQNELYGHLDRNMRQLSRMSEENRRAAFAASDLGDRTTTLTKDVDHAGDSLRAASTHVRRFGDDSDDSGRRLRGLSRVLANFGGRGLGGDFSKLTASLGPLRGGIGALVIITATLGPVLLAAAGSTIALVSALGPLVGLGPAAAVGLGALAQAAGVVALAFAGVGDALKEQLDVQDKAAKLSLSNADQQRSAARAIQAAQDGVRAANERVTRAGEDLAKAEKAQTDATKALAVARQQAKRDLQDMHASLANASLTEKRATLDLADARAALAKALAPADVSRLADAQAELTNSTLSEQRAVMSLADARQRLEDLMKPADALTLADAQDAVADAARGETRAALALADARKKAEGVLASASSTDEDKARAKLDLADAENAIGDASRASAKAQQQLQKLQAGPDPKEVAKAKFDVAAAEQAVADAQRNTAKSSAAVNDAMKGANPAEVARATLDVASAEQALADAQRARARLQKDIAAADKAGVKGAAAMVQARRQLAQANDQVTDAERGVVEAQRAATRATEALRDAQVSAASSTAKAGLAAQALNEKFDALPPAAQAFVRKLVELKPKLDELRAIAAAGLFPGVIKGIEAAQGAFEPLKRVVGETAGTLSGLTERAGELVGSKGFGKDLETIGHRNALVLDRTGRATFYLAGAMKDLIVAAGPLTTWLAKATLEWARNVKASTQAGRESGRLADFFQRTKNTLQLVGSVLGNLAGAFYAVGKSAAPFGRDILHSLDAVTGRFETWAKSTKGQKSLTDFFRQSNELMGSLMPVLGEVSKSFVGLTFRVFPAYVKILEALGPLAGPLIHAYVTWKVAATGVAIATGLVTAATKAWTAAQWLLNAALTANPIGIVVTAIAALVAGFIVAYKKSETFRDIVNGALNAVKDAAVAVFGWIKVNWPLLLGILAGPFGLLVIEIVKHWGAIKDLAASLPGTVAGAIKTGASTLVNAGKWVLDQIIGGFKAVASGITGAASWLFGKLKGGLDALADVFGNRGKDVLAWIIGGFKAVTSGIASAGKWVLDTLKSVLDGLAGNFVNRGKDIIGWIVDGLTFVSDKGISAVSGVGEWLLKQLKHMLDSIKDGVEGLGGTVMDWIIGGLKKGAFELQGFLNKIIHVINKIPGVDIKDINVLKKDKNGDVTGFARGGAYGRTGGLVSAPITLMGEEAPCIARGTMIETEFGALAIEDVDVGTFVRTRSGWRKVLWSGVTRRNAEVVRVRVVDGYNVLCTPDHRIWSASGGTDADRSRNRVGCWPVRGGGVLSHHELARQESVRGAGVADDGPGYGGAVPGDRWLNVRTSHPQARRAQDDLCHGPREAGRRGTDHPVVSPVAWRAPKGEGAGIARVDRRAERCGDPAREVLPEGPFAHAGEHLRQPQGLRHLSGVQAGPRPGVEQEQVCDRHGACGEGAEGGSRVRSQEACRSGMERAPQGAAPGLVSPEACWREARELAVGDWVFVLADDGEFHASRVESVTAEPRIDTYDLMVDDEHEFVAGGILVHNSHPEYVIPTNPAYRKRAQGLAMQAAKAVGLARGGIYSQGEIEDLWVAAKGPESQRRIAGAVGMAESGGDTHAIGPETRWGRAKGLMQILGQVVPGDLFDPLVNMRNAVKKWQDAGGWSPWEAFTGPDGVGSDGPYLKFLNGGGGILGKIGSAISGAAGSVADMVKGLVGKLPGTGGLDWLAGTGKYVLGKVKDWIKSKVGGLFGGASTNPISPGVSGSIEDAIKVAMGLGFARPSTNQLTGGKHAPTSYHYQGRAADFGAAGHSVAEMTGLFNALLGKYGSHLKELFYDPVGYYVKNGAKVSGAIGGHSDHLHVALAKGGMFGGLPYLGTYHDGGVAPREGIAHVAAGERMTPAGVDGGVHIHGDLVVREEADVELLARKLAFRLN